VIYFYTIHNIVKSGIMSIMIKSHF